MRSRIPLACAAAMCLLGTFASALHAGVTNPDISVIGQPSVRVTDDSNDPARKRPVMDVGETEVSADAYLNPYAKGFFVFSFGGSGVSVEEGYFTMLRGLPAGLALKGGKYRVGFGKLNPQHPHAYPFAERFNVLKAYLPGDEAFNETGLQLSKQFALPHDIALTAAADWLQGDSFRIPREPSAAANDPLASLSGAAADRSGEPRAAGLGRLSAFVPVGDRSGIELGGSYTRGTNNVAAATTTTVWGGDVKAKIWSSASSYVVIQGEMLGLDRENAGWDSTSAAFTKTAVRPTGGYVYADYNFNPRYDAGVGYEHWQTPDESRTTNQAFRAFAGLSLMEETTAFRLDWEHRLPGAASGAPAPDAINTLTLRVIYSMGPHKAHQF